MKIVISPNPIWSYIVEYDAGGLPSGIYFYQLQTPRLLDLILIVCPLFSQPLLNNIGGGFLFSVILGIKVSCHMAAEGCPVDFYC